VAMIVTGDDAVIMVERPPDPSALSFSDMRLLDEAVEVKWSYAILAQLIEGPRHFMDLYRHLTADRATVSYTLKVLEEYGLISSSKQTGSHASSIYRLTGFGAKMVEGIPRLTTAWMQENVDNMDVLRKKVRSKHRKWPFGSDLPAVVGGIDVEGLYVLDVALDDAWALAILRLLMERPHTFMEFTGLVDASKSVLRYTLSHLEDYGFVTHTKQPAAPRSSTYQLTDFGVVLLRLGQRITSWMREHADEIRTLRENVQVKHHKWPLNQDE
jgi:DNA-binding HxlR family transcriptional regulator